MTAVVFLVSILFDIYAFVLLARILAAYNRLDFRNPVSRALIRLTDPLLVPLRRLLPGWGGVDWSAILLLLVIEAVAVSVLTSIVAGALPSPGALALWTVARGLQALLNLLLFVVLVRVVLSWVSPGGYNPAAAMVFGLSEPLLRPLRRYMPALEGLDLSPMVLIIGLVAIKLLTRDLTALPFYL